MRSNAANACFACVEGQIWAGFYAAMKETFIGPGTVSPCSSRSAINLNARACTAAVACFRVRPYAVMPVKLATPPRVGGGIGAYDSLRFLGTVPPPREIGDTAQGGGE